MVARVAGDTNLVVVLAHNDQEIERVVASSPGAVAPAIRALCRRGDDLQAGDVLRVPAPG
jgi:hypothetical protein